MQHSAAPSTRKLMKLVQSAIEKQRMQEAVDLLQQVLALNPTHAEALYQLGYILHASGNYGQAGQFYERAIQADGQHFQSYSMLCKVLEAQERNGEALQLAQLATRAMPDEPRAYCLMASMMMRFTLVHEVPEYLAQIVPQFPNHTELHQLYAIALKANDRFAEADAVYGQLIAHHRVPASFRIIYETLLPRLLESAEQIDTLRTQFAQSIAQFTKEKPRLDIGLLSNYPLFLLAYHNRDNRELLQAYTKMLRAIAPELNYTAPHCKAALVRGDRPIRIGFISRHMHNHPVGNCYRNTMLHLAAQKEFSVTFFNLANIMDEKIEEIIAAGVPMVALPKNIAAAQKAVAEHALDILIYTDIGMDATTHYMAMARLAPYQLCLGGHPETTGIDTIDYVVSSRSYEPEHAQENYTEQLLCVAGVNTILTRPAPPERWLTREELGLPADRNLYVCPMAIQKLHPDFDGILAGILAADPKATLVLFNDFQQENATVKMQSRILKHCDPARVMFMPWLSKDEFQSVLKLADTVLDTIYFGGGTTVQYAFNLGVPMVTMPGHWARGRGVYSYYEVLEIDQPPIAETPEEYVRLAVKLANNVDYKTQLSSQILARSERLFEVQSYAPLITQMMRDILAQQLDSYAR